METLKDYIEERLEQIKELYTYYLEGLDHEFDPKQRITLYNRLRDLRVEKTTLENVKDVMEGKTDEDSYN